MDYPIHLKLRSRRVLVIGAGKVAERRIKTLLKAGAEIRVVAPAATPYIETTAEAGKITLIKREFSPADFGGEMRPFFVIIATPDATLNRQIADAAHEKNILVNMAAPPLDAGDFIIPSHIDAGDILLSIGTNGQSPALSRLLRQTLEEKFAAPFAAFLARLAPLRAEGREIIPPAEREAFWREVLNEKTADLILSGQPAEAEAIIEDALDKYRP